MSDSRFLDTNILLYLYSTDEKKRTVARSLLSTPVKPFISRQVVHEFANVFLKKFGMKADDVALALTDFDNNLRIVEIDGTQTRKALDIVIATGYGYYDSLMISAALAGGCDILYSEDMQHGRRIESIEIINPFL